MEYSLRTKLIQKKLVIIAILFFAALVALLFVAPIPQDPAYHRFADARRFLGIANFGDVVSNVGFAIVGLWGLFRILGAATTPLFDHPMDSIPYVVFFLGVALIGPGSGIYHAGPDNATLFWDRLPMTIAFMAFFAAVIADRIHRRAGIFWLLPSLLMVGVLALVYWQQTELAGVGDLRFYGMVQFFPLVAIPVIIRLFPERRYTSGRSLVWVILWYAIAKVFEYFDKEIFDLLGGTVSGHSLKHLASAVAVYMIVDMLLRSVAEAGAQQT
jgi:hypothetical protein